jgi:hypothetical protein
MINGAHAILYSDDADATRAALAKVLGTRSVDAGDRPAGRGIEVARPVSDQGWGLRRLGSQNHPQGCWMMSAA